MQYSRCDPTTDVTSNGISEIEGVRDMFLQYHRSQHKFTCRDKATLSHFPKGKFLKKAFYVNYFFQIEHSADTSKLRNIIGHF